MREIVCLDFMAFFLELKRVTNCGFRFTYRRVNVVTRSELRFGKRSVGNMD